MYYCNRQKVSPQKPLHFFGSGAILKLQNNSGEIVFMPGDPNGLERQQREDGGRRGSIELYFPQNKASGHKTVPKSLHLCLKGPF